MTSEEVQESQGRFAPPPVKLLSMDLFPNEQNFDLDKSRQKFHHSLKEHHKISNISK